jgi:hypothetical protein
MGRVMQAADAGADEVSGVPATPRRGSETRKAGLSGGLSCGCNFDRGTGPQRADGLLSKSKRQRLNVETGDMIAR